MIKNIYQEARAPNRHITNVKFKLFIQIICSYWQTICNLPNLFELAELISQKQDQLMKQQWS
ncbi:unnamed protein product [Paramecium octaurelia]|uniref:Uncharacterized protein n=1 Tax=Paramecium octaurelia TaxID=43137 RepID=A0A8S1SQ93_PAROT|nr:unnamed protein product [Paramecium octaurelia]